MVATKRKQCENVLNDCPKRKDRPLEYHCVRHAESSKPVEVCARNWISQGHCVEYDPTRKEVVSNFEKNCTSFQENPCPQIFNSPDNYKYQRCYDEFQIQQTGVTPLTTTSTTTPLNEHSTDAGDSNGNKESGLITVIILCGIILAVLFAGIGIAITLYLRAQRIRTITGLINASVEETEMNRM